MHVSGAIALERSATPMVIRIGSKASLMTRALLFEYVPDAEPFFISRRLIIPRRSKSGNVLRSIATFQKSVHLPLRNKLTPSSNPLKECRLMVRRPRSSPRKGGPR